MTTPPRRRASALSPEQRRETIVHAALPLVAERGAAVTTAEVARAAGIAEGTIFRVFPDKNALLDAVVVEVLRPDHVLAELASIDLDQPLATRLTEAGEALAAHLARLGAVLGSLHASGRPLQRRPPQDADDAAPDGSATGAASGAQPVDYFGRADSTRAAAARRSPADGPNIGRDESQLATAAALTELFEPERDHLRVHPEQAAGIFLSLLFARGRQPRPAADLETTVDVFLHGALDVPAPV